MTSWIKFTSASVSHQTRSPL